MEFEFNVNMTCEHCVNAVKEALQTIDNISEIEINLEKKTVKGIVTDKNTSADQIKKIIEDIGFDVT